MKIIKQLVYVTTSLATKVVDECMAVEAVAEVAHHLETNLHVNFVENMDML